MHRYASGAETWHIEVDEPMLRRLAAGIFKEIPLSVSIKAPPEPRKRVGEAFAIWGEGPTDRCMVTSDKILDRLLGGLQLRARSQNHTSPVIFGSTYGDHRQVVVTRRKPAGNDRNGGQAG